MSSDWIGSCSPVSPLLSYRARGLSKSSLILVLISSYGIGVFGCCIYFSSTSGDHRFFRARMALQHMHTMTKHLQVRGSLPDPKDFNVRLKERWALGRDHVPKEEEDDSSGWLLDFIIERATQDHVYPWDAPPRFVLTSANRDGYGFYLDGEDGISKTKGRDRDDINSWDPSSSDYYYDRRLYRAILMLHVVGSTSAMVVFLVYVLFKGNEWIRPAT